MVAVQGKAYWSWKHGTVTGCGIEHTGQSYKIHITEMGKNRIDDSRAQETNTSVIRAVPTRPDHKEQ